MDRATLDEERLRVVQVMLQDALMSKALTGVRLSLDAFASMIRRTFDLGYAAALPPVTHSWDKSRKTSTSR